MIKPQNFNIPGKRPRILIAPLDWGLGHATRCIPIIEALLAQNCEVVVAATAPVKKIIESEFPNLNFIPAAGYRIQYSRHRFWFPVAMISQLPKLFYRIYKENRWLQHIVSANQIDAIISDNRLGLYHKTIPCMYITHQLTIKSRNVFTEKIIQKIHYHFINKFNECWVPDASGKINLAGSLSHPALLPHTPVVYLGPLSRFKKISTTLQYDCCVLLSGPEPQRTVFENILLNQLKTFQGKVFFLRGLPDNNTLPALKLPGIDIKNHLPASELNLIVQQSATLICRSGYTSVMDLVKLQKKAILVPTPGQTEQEYLAKYLFDNRLFYTVSQHQFSLTDDLNKANFFLQETINIPFDNYQTVVEKFAVKIKKTTGAGI